MRPRAVSNVVRGELTDGEVVVSITGGQRALILNALGDTVLDLCDGSRTLEDIAALITSALTVPPNANVLHDVSALVQELVSAGLVEALE